MKRTVIMMATGCALLYGAAVNGWLDLPMMPNPANPPAGSARVYISSTSGKLACLNASGADCIPAVSAVSNVRMCEVVVGDPGAASPYLANDNDSPAICANKTGAPLTITAVECYANGGSGTTVNVNITGAASVLSGNLTCGTAAFAAGTLSGAPTQASGASLDANIIDTDGTAKYIVIRVTRTL
jgi:hypothetical protein